jgi:trimethylamine--corrinoid protein Co-methyltransferase
MNLDVIKEVGPGGEFITHSHTFNNMRSMSKSNLFDRRDRAAWIEHTKGKDLTERAYEEARHIVKTHKPIALPKGASETMKSIIEDSEAENDQTGEKNEVHQT